MDFNSLLQTYLGHDQSRIYSEGDYVLRYHPSYGSVCLHRLLVSSTTGPFNKSYWSVETCQPIPGGSLNLVESAGYLGDCVLSIVYKTKQTSPPPLPQFIDTFFDNITHI